MCTDNGFSGCFDTTPCFPNSLVVNLVKEFRTQSAQNPSEKHFAWVITIVSLLMTPLITTHEPPSTSMSVNLPKGRFGWVKVALFGVLNLGLG